MKNRLSQFLVIFVLITFASILNAQDIITEEGFKDVTNLPGWEFSNQSAPIGDSSWFQGNTKLFSAFAGESSSYIAANHRNVAVAFDPNAVICNYLIAPDLGALKSINFVTRSTHADNGYNIFPDRLYVVYSPNGGINPGNCTDGFGDFTETLLVINHELSSLSYPDGYPLTSWQKFNLDINGSGRIAFVYYVPEAGFYGKNSNYIGIDSFNWVYQAPSVPAPLFASGFEE